MQSETLRDGLQYDIAFARVRLHMGRAEFMRQTPAEWAAVCEAYRRREQENDDRENRRTARICMVIARVFGNDQLTEEDFIPHVEEEQTPEEMMAVLDALGERHNKPNG